MIIGCKVVILHMGSDMAWTVMNQAHNMGLMDDGYVWLNTDSVTMGQLPTKESSRFTGLFGTRPMASKSNLYSTFFGRNDSPRVSVEYFLLYFKFVTLP